MNIFSLYGRNFRDDENRLTVNLMFLLDQARGKFLPGFLQKLNLESCAGEISKIELGLQEHHRAEEEISFVDGYLRLEGVFEVFIESKVKHNTISAGQASKYAKLLHRRQAANKLLLFITQKYEPHVEAVVHAEISKSFPNVKIRFMRWHEIFMLLRATEDLTDKGRKASDLKILKGKTESAETRLAYLFLEEAQKMAYQLCDIDDQKIEHVEDVVIQLQDEWFMKTALDWNIWFPPAQSRNGLRPTKYVAYYQTQNGGNPNPKHITHVARVRKVWNRLSVEDAKHLEAFSDFFADKKASERVLRFGTEKEGLFHMALTDTPVKLKKPIPLGKPSTAQFLAKKRFSLPRMLNAETTDDLLAGAALTQPEDME